MSGLTWSDVTVSDMRVALDTARKTRAGTWFVFTENLAPSGRLARLLARQAKERLVLPLSGVPVELPGLRIARRDRGIEPLACLVADRDLYRAGQDTVNLFCGVPGQQAVYGKSGLSIVLACNGVALTARDVDLGKHGIAIEPFASLMPGRYTARLTRGGVPLGAEAAFTVAEYSLAPLTARLLAHRLDRTADLLHFELAVESYQVPFDRELDVALVERGREVTRTRIAARAAGVYAGSIALGDREDALRLRLTAAGDASRIAEVAIPGSRRHERVATVVSELGREILLSLMPEAGALPIRGAYLSQGDFLATPLTVDRVDTAEGVLRAQADLESLVLVALDLATGTETVIDKGDVAAGTAIDVPPAALCTVFAGAWVGGQPFEGFTSFFRPPALGLQVSAPQTVRPREEVSVRLAVTSAPAGEAVPVLLCVRDQRLTAADTPETALAASAKKSVETATAGMREAGIGPVLPALPPTLLGVVAEAAGGYLRPATAAPRSRAPMAYTPPTIEEDTLEFDEAPTAEEPAGTITGVDLAAVMRSAGAPMPAAAATAAPSPRADFPQVLFYGLVPVRGEETVRIPAGDTLTTFVVEAFALAGGDWAQERASFVVDRPVRADLDLPPAVHAADRVTGRLRVAAAGGQARVRLTRDGEAVVLRGADGEAIATPAELAFDARPGAYVATVEDAATGERDVVEVHVGTPGRFRSLLREVGLLQKGDLITLDSAGALSLRVLPGLETQFKQLVTATADYGHLCCEQTAAKVLASAVMWLTAEGPAARSTAESAILAGLARERTMWKQGRGFSMYPQMSDVNRHYSPLVVRHLWRLAPLAGAPEASRALGDAVRDALAMANDVAKPFKLQRVPARIACMEDAFTVAREAASRRSEARTCVLKAIDLAGAEPTLRERGDRVGERAELAYAAATLLALGELASGVRVANVVTRQLDGNGRLYSTIDSVAAIALFGELRRTGVVSGTGRVKVNGAEMASNDAVRLSDQVETIEVLEGFVPVEVSRIHEEDWSRFSADLPLRIGFRDGAGGGKTRFGMGDRVDLQVELPKGYQPGDLVHVALPASLSWIEGGGKVKRFTRDFEGSDRVTVPLVVTGEMAGPEHFAVCVRNMFREERAASPGLLAIGS